MKKVWVGLAMLVTCVVLTGIAKGLQNSENPSLVIILVFLIAPMLSALLFVIAVTVADKVTGTKSYWNNDNPSPVTVALNGIVFLGMNASMHGTTELPVLLIALALINGWVTYKTARWFDTL